jgi:hypothetical protein
MSASQPIDVGAIYARHNERARPRNERPNLPSGAERPIAAAEARAIFARMNAKAAERLAIVAMMDRQGSA